MIAFGEFDMMDSISELQKRLARAGAWLGGVVGLPVDLSKVTLLADGSGTAAAASAASAAR